LQHNRVGRDVQKAWGRCSVAGAATAVVAAVRSRAASAAASIAGAAAAPVTIAAAAIFAVPVGAAVSVAAAAVPVAAPCASSRSVVGGRAFGTLLGVDVEHEGVVEYGADRCVVPRDNVHAVREPYVGSTRLVDGVPVFSDRLCAARRLEGDASPQDKSLRAQRRCDARI
jgi:hypothetical protein